MIIDENGVKIAIAHNNLSRSAEHLGKFCNDGSAKSVSKNLDHSIDCLRNFNSPREPAAFGTANGRASPVAALAQPVKLRAAVAGCARGATPGARPRGRRSPGSQHTPSVSTQLKIQNSTRKRARKTPRVCDKCWELFMKNSNIFLLQHVYIMDWVYDPYIFQLQYFFYWR